MTEERHRHQVTGIDPHSPYLCACGATYDATAEDVLAGPWGPTEGR